MEGGSGKVGMSQGSSATQGHCSVQTCSEKVVSVERRSRRAWLLQNQPPRFMSERIILNTGDLRKK